MRLQHKKINERKPIPTVRSQSFPVKHRAVHTMSVTHLSWSTLILLSSVLALLCLCIYHRFFVSRYWSKRGVPHVEPVFLLGNMWKMGFFENFWNIIQRIHVENRQRKILGFWIFVRPILLVLDVQIIKRILIRDFNVFRDRGIEIDTNMDPLAGHLFMLKGKRWRNLRVKLTPTFTSGKMKMMFPTMVNCGIELRKHLKKAADRKDDVEVKDLMARFTTDVISSVAFGIETNSLENPNSEFREFGKKIFKVDFNSLIRNILLMIFPAMLKMMKLRLIPKDITEFFVNAVQDTIEFREKNKTTRNDFLQLLIQLMRAGKIEDVDKTPIDGLTDEELVEKFSLNDAAAQCFLFFVAGFEASSSVLTFALYELALNPDIQTKIQDEIDSILENHSSEVTYDAMSKMQYLDMVIDETFRKYPPVANIQRISFSDYRIPDLGVTIDKGTMVMISVSGIHHDPQYYPNPEKFDPERFAPEMKARRDPMAFLPFGEGPRNCIGNRFALMQIKVCLISILRDFTVDVSKNTPIPIVFDIKSFMPTSKTGVPLSFKARARSMTQ